jgi:hypothetical protein
MRRIYPLRHRTSFVILPAEAGACNVLASGYSRPFLSPQNAMARLDTGESEKRRSESDRPIRARSAFSREPTRRRVRTTVRGVMSWRGVSREMLCACSRASSPGTTPQRAPPLTLRRATRAHRLRLFQRMAGSSISRTRGKEPATRSGPARLPKSRRPVANQANTRDTPVGEAPPERRSSAGEFQTHASRSCDPGMVRARRASDPVNRETTAPAGREAAPRQ